VAGGGTVKNFYSTIQPATDVGGYVLKIIAEREPFPRLILFRGEEALMMAKDVQNTMQAMIRSIGGQFTVVA